MTPAATRTMSAEERVYFEERLAELPSPFSDSVLANAFCETPDVPTIHAEARAACLAHVKSARDRAKTTLQVITGDAGEGKTHLIAWLRRQSMDAWRKATTGGRFAIAVVPPLRSLSRVAHHVLQEVVRQLAIRLPDAHHMDDATDTPIEIVVWRALLALAKRLVEDRHTPRELSAMLTEAVDVDPERFLSTAVSHLKEALRLHGTAFADAALRLPDTGLDREIFRVVARFGDGEEPERAAIVDWLGGASLPQEKLTALGTELVLDEEDGAMRGLVTVLALSRLAGTPVVIAFDQIEGTVRLGEDAVPELLSAIAELYNEVRGAVLVILCQTQLWPVLREKAAAHVRDRLDDTRAIHLRALTPEQAVAVVEARMQRFWAAVDEQPNDPMFPLGRETVTEHVARANLRTPRAVVRYFQALLREPPEARGGFVEPAKAAPSDIVRKKLESYAEESRRHPRPPDTRAAIAQAVLLDVLGHAARTKRTTAGATVVSCEPKRLSKTGISGVLVHLARGESVTRVYVEGSNSSNGKSAASTAKRLADAVTQGVADRAVLLREAALPLPKAAQKALLELTPRGAILRLDDGAVAELAALEALLNAAASKDIPVDRATALDLALAAALPKISVLEASFAELVLTDEAPRPATAGTGGTERATPPSSEPTEAARRAAEAILRYLVTERMFEPIATLAAALGLTVEAADQAVGLLEEGQKVERVLDRNRAPVALLRPEGFVS